MDTSLLKELHAAAAASRPISPSAALDLLHTGSEDLAGIFASADAMTSSRFGRTVSLCAIVNAKSGACSEDCAFCAQSRYATLSSPVYPFMQAKDLHAAYASARQNNAKYFGLVTSGKALHTQEIEKACSTVRSAPAGPYWCASMGCLDAKNLRLLQKAGIKRYHHNLETAPGFYSKICSTHSMEERIETLRRARATGLELCSGGIFGLGESKVQRVELATTLASEKVESIPINFLQPLKGTRLEQQTPLRPLEMLLTIAMLRFTNPWAEIRIAAGRKSLGRLQAMLFYAGCSGMMIGDLLTTTGENVAADHAMLAALNLKIETAALSRVCF